MYDDDRGTRLTVHVQPMGIDGEELRYIHQGEVRTIVWAELRLALVVTGRVSRDRLMAVARRVQDDMGLRGAPLAATMRPAGRCPRYGLTSGDRDAQPIPLQPAHGQDRE